MSAPTSLSISIPAYNEEATIGSLIERSLQILSRHTSDYEVVVIDDGSTDRTGAIMDEWAKKDAHVRVLHHDTNKGFGQTLREVFTAPSKEWVFFIPGDGQIPPEELTKLLPWHHRADFILGWRVHRADPWKRRVTATVYNLMISLILGRRIHDVDSVAFFRRQIADQFTLEATSVFLHAEFCLKAVRAGARFAEVPIDHRPREAGEARGNRPGVILQTFKEMLAYALSSKPPIRS